MFNYPYLVELLTPKRPADEQTESLLHRFTERYQKIMEVGWGISIPDNPMGQPRLGALESISQAGLSIDPERVVMNLNTFHAKSELDQILENAAKSKLKYILVVRGDGGPRLSKLDPKSIGGKLSVTTSYDLIRYINTQYPDQFVTGAAFNPYKPMAAELKRMHQKIEAGAAYIVTQPIIGQDEKVDHLKELGIPIVVEAWMSKNIDLFYKSVGIIKDERADAYHPTENLKALHQYYPECCVYLSMLSFKQDWRIILPKVQ